MKEILNYYLSLINYHLSLLFHESSLSKYGNLIEEHNAFDFICFACTVFYIHREATHFQIKSDCYNLFNKSINCGEDIFLEFNFFFQKI